MSNVFIALLLASIVLLPASAFGREFKDFRASYSGSTACCAEDLNQDGTPGGRSIFSGKSTLGQIRQIHQVVDIDFFTFLDPTADCKAGADVKVLISNASAIIEFSDGSKLFKRLAMNGRESFACADLDGDDFSNQLSWDIIGGTGRFDGATGESTSLGLDITFLPGQNYLEFSETGTISLPKP